VTDAIEQQRFKDLSRKTTEEEMFMDFDRQIENSDSYFYR